MFPFITPSLLGASEEMEEIFEPVIWLLVKRVSNEECQFVGVLADGRDSHCPSPVVVQVGHLIGQLLDVVWGEAGGVEDDIVGGWVDGALAHGLGDEEEIETLRKGHNVVHHSTRRRVCGILLASRLHGQRTNLWLW